MTLTSFYRSKREENFWALRMYSLQGQILLSLSVLVRTLFADEEKEELCSCLYLCMYNTNTFIAGIKAKKGNGEKYVKCLIGLYRRVLVLFDVYIGPQNLFL